MTIRRHCPAATTCDELVSTMDRLPTFARLAALAEKMRADLGDRGAPGPGIRPIGRVGNPVPVR